MQGELAGVGQHGLPTRLKRLGEIARVTAQGLVGLGDELAVPVFWGAGVGECAQRPASGEPSAGAGFEAAPLSVGGAKLTSETE